MTDVEELGVWMRERVEAHPLFEQLSVADMEADVVVPWLTATSEEGKKVARNEGNVYISIFRRIPDP